MNWSTLLMAVAAPLIGVATGLSTQEWMDAADNGEQEYRAAKEALLDSAGLRQRHHEVYAKVGEQTWENQVKPDFLSAITWATVRDTGTLLPDWKDITEWVRAHPEEARRLLDQAAAAAGSP